MEASDEQSMTITHDFPVWREKANFILAAPLKGADVPSEWRWEQLWARQVKANVFEICCVPFFAYGIALGDLVSTSTVEGKHYTVDRILKRSGHTTYRIWFLDVEGWNSVVENIRNLDCAVEQRWNNSKLIAVDAHTIEVKKSLERYLRELDSVGVITYEVGT